MELYTNSGKGLVLKNNTIARKAYDLFMQRRNYTNAELNDLLGWQFSQAVFTLRQKGLNIVTLTNGREFSYELREGTYAPRTVPIHKCETCGK